MFRRLAACLAAGALLFCCESDAAARTLTFQGKASAAVRRAATVPFTMRVEEVLVSVGDAVQKDTPLLRYSLLPQDARNLQNALTNSYASVLDLRQQLASLAQEARNASGSVKRDRELARDGLAPQAEVQRSVSTLNTVSMRRELSQRRLATNQRNDALLLEEYNSYFGSHLKPGDSLPERFYLTAPVAGAVIDLAAAVRPGGYVDPHVPAATVAVLNPIQAEVLVHETEIANMRKEMQVEIEVPNLAGRKYAGRVTSISWSSTDMTVGMPSFYVVQVDIDNADFSIRPGYKVLLHVDVQ